MQEFSFIGCDYHLFFIMRFFFLVLLQSVEFSKLVGLLKPEEPDDVILSACQKLLSFFVQRPEQKHVFMSQHGFLPLMDLLEIPRNRVCSFFLLITRIFWKLSRVSIIYGYSFHFPFGLSGLSGSNS